MCYKLQLQSRKMNKHLTGIGTSSFLRPIEASVTDGLVW